MNLLQQLIPKIDEKEKKKPVDSMVAKCFNRHSHSFYHCLTHTKEKQITKNNVWNKNFSYG